jgi:hypothetical protein
VLDEESLDEESLDEESLDELSDDALELDPEYELIELLESLELLLELLL